MYLVRGSDSTSRDAHRLATCRSMRVTAKSGAALARRFYQCPLLQESTRTTRIRTTRAATRRQSVGVPEEWPSEYRGTAAQPRESAVQVCGALSLIPEPRRGLGERRRCYRDVEVSREQRPRRARVLCRPQEPSASGTAGHPARRSAAATRARSSPLVGVDDASPPIRVR
jgi:hypothetical protein